MGTILSEVKGFTPVIDVIVEDVGLRAAAVYGVVWRYCQMKNGVCYASQETIGKKLGFNRRTVRRYLKKLCEAGYLTDTRPTTRNRPHLYVDSGRVIIAGLVEARLVGKSAHLGETICPSRWEDLSHEDSIKKENKIYTRSSFSESDNLVIEIYGE